MRGEIAVRELGTPDEFLTTADISKAAWRFSAFAISPPSDLIAATHAGGLTAGAFEGKRMLGFVHGLPRTNLPEPAHHSHLLAVRPEAQGRGLSVKLKLFQRAWCLQRGIRLVTWTYDPFLLKNARLNLSRLRASIRAFLPNFYGAMGGIYGALPTDRFEVSWRLDDPLVTRAARGERLPDDPFDGVPAVTGSLVPDAPRLAVPFPAGAPRIYRTDHTGTLRARRAFARAVIPLFTRGYEVTGVAERPSGPVYVFDRQ